MRLTFSVTVDVEAPDGEAAAIATKELRRALRGITRRRAAVGIRNYIVQEEPDDLRH